MKHLLIILVSLLIGTIQMSASNVKPSLTLFSTDKSIVLKKSGLLALANTITIIDADGVSIFTHNLRTDNQTIKYNLENLPNGRYLIEINGDQLTEIHEAIITNNEIALSSVERYYSPALICQNDKILINLLSTTPEWITCNIYNNSGELVYDYEEFNDGSLNRTFNLDQLDSGKYNIYLSTNHFSQNLRVNL